MMESLQENNSESAQDMAAEVVQASVQPTVGRLLREERERQGMSVDEVYSKIKLPPRQINALESDDYSVLPETAFVRGFVRSYAKLLKLDAQPLLDALPGAQPEPVREELEPVEAPFPSERISRRQNIKMLIAALMVALVIAVFAVWQANAPPSAPKPEPVQIDTAASDVMATPLPLPEQVEMLDASAVQADSAASATPALAPVAAPAASAIPAVAPVVHALQPASAVPASYALRLAFDKDAWVEIKDKSGKTISNQVNKAGSELRVEGAAPFSLVVGHAASVHLYYREKPVDLVPATNASSEVARLKLE